MKIKTRTKRQKKCKFHGTCRYTRDECTTLKVQIRQVKHKEKKKKHQYGEIHTFEKMSTSNSSNEAMNSSASEDSEI